MDRKSTKALQVQTYPQSRRVLHIDFHLDIDYDIKTRTLLITTLFLSAQPVKAAPNSHQEERALNCKVIDNVVNYSTRYTAQASSFCTAYLQTTSTTTATSAAKTTTITAKGASTVTKTVYSTAVNTFTKRDASNTARPTWLTYVIGAQLVSSACSCYITPPPPKTATSTKKGGTATVTSSIVTTTTAVPIYCAVHGCGNGEGYLTGTNEGSVQACKATCVNEAGCQTFQYLPDDGSCSLYSATVMEQEPGS